MNIKLDKKIKAQLKQDIELFGNAFVHLDGKNVHRIKPMDVTIKTYPQQYSDPIRKLKIDGVAK